MGYKLKTDVSAQWLAESLGLELVGLDTSISSVAQLSEINSFCLTFSIKEIGITSQLNAVIIGNSKAVSGFTSVLSSENPRLDFARALHCLELEIGFVKNEDPPQIHPSVKIGKNVVIESGVEIGKDTVIGHNVVIKCGVKIGESCIVQSSTVVGDDGFGFERDENGVPVRLLHLGNVVIGNDVEIGNCVTIDRGTLSDTVIHDYVKIDNHVHIAHNCNVGKSSIVTASSVFCGGVILEEEVWIAPNANLMQKITIGKGALVGLGATVLEDVEPGSTVYPNKYVTRNRKS